jgi:hypothetical protein
MPPLCDPRVQGWIPWELTRLDQRKHAPHKARTWPKGSRVPADRSAATRDGRCRHESTGDHLEIQVGERPTVRSAMARRGTPRPRASAATQYEISPARSSWSRAMLPRRAPVRASPLLRTTKITRQHTRHGDLTRAAGPHPVHSHPRHPRAGRQGDTLWMTGVTRSSVIERSCSGWTLDSASRSCAICGGRITRGGSPHHDASRRVWRRSAPLRGGGSWLERAPVFRKSGLRAESR